MFHPAILKASKYCGHLSWLAEVRLNIKRWSRNRLIFNMGIPGLGKTVFILRRGPGGQAGTWVAWQTIFFNHQHMVILILWPHINIKCGALMTQSNIWYYIQYCSNRPVSQIRAPPGGLSLTSGKLWQDYSNCYMFWTWNAISFNLCSIHPHFGILVHP